MESESAIRDRKNKDPQKQAVYNSQFELCRPLGDEILPREAAQAAVKGIWEEVVSLPLRPPSIHYEPKYSRHRYYPWKHQITFSCRPNKTPTVHLLHELGHAWIAALGTTFFAETHGPFFLAKFGRMWSLYATKSFEMWQNRCQARSLRISSRVPDLSSHSWARVKEGGHRLAVRPAQRAIQLGLNIEKTFSSIKKNHPMSFSR